jgi:DNA repair protein RAD50
MSSITSLSIRGIRSFGPEEAATIVFAKPLTVIVGANGCGKTTIIECLKFATTGALPPGSAAGQSFVHDPKMSHASEVKGQIKLKFKNKINQTMVCVRDLQVSQARSKYTYKALDATLMMMHTPDGAGAAAGGKKEIVSMSKTTTAMDSLMHELLGVPKAVLEHVVFCACPCLLFF